MKLKDTRKNARTKIEVPLGSALLCEIVNGHVETRYAQDTSRKTKERCILEAHESTGTRVGKTDARDHQDLITILCASLFPYTKL